MWVGNSHARCRAGENLEIISKDYLLLYSILLVKTKKEAIQALENIKRFLKENLHLELNNKTQIFKSSQGVNYCGYKINEYRLKIRDKGKKKLKKKIKYLRYEIKNGRMTSKDAKRYLAGHLGYLKIANTRNLELKIFGE